LDAPVVGGARVGYTRLNVYKDVYEFLEKRVSGMGFDIEVTRRELQLGPRDSTTGWCEKNYPIEETINLLVLTRDASKIMSLTGTYVRLDAVGLTLDPVTVGDEIITDHNVFYEVNTVKDHYVANNFVYRVCDLRELPLHEAS